MADASTKVVSEIRDGVARITLNHPPLNILDIPMMAELQNAVGHWASQKETKVLVIGHLGKAFSVGVSIQDHTPDMVEKMLEAFHGVFRLLESLSLPTVALVDGMALGGGCELAIFCDLVLASERATFGQPEIKVGVFPPVAAALFPRLVGRNRALELLMTGETVTASEACHIGLINRVFPTESFQERSEEFLRNLTSLSAPVVKLTKKVVDAGRYMSVSAALTAAEQIYLRELMQTEDAREGLQAFLEKRKPVWKDR